MSEIKLVAERRTAFGKGAARRIRRDHKIPAVLYGHGTAPVHITLPGHDTMMALKHANALLSIELDGASQLALAKDVQRDPIRPVIEHVDLVIVRRGEKVTVDVPVHVEGEAGPETVVTVESQAVALLVEATDIPGSIVVSVAGLPAGTQIKAAELELPEGAALAVDEELLVVNITAMISEAALEAELAEAEAVAGVEREEAGEPGAAEEPGAEAGAEPAAQSADAE